MQQLERSYEEYQRQARGARISAQSLFQLGYPKEAEELGKIARDMERRAEDVANYLKGQNK